MFKNCGENDNPRHEWVHDNLIEYNIFHGNNVGVFIASRQGIPRYDQHIYACPFDGMDSEGPPFVPVTSESYVLPASVISKEAEACFEPHYYDDTILDAAEEDHFNYFNTAGFIRYIRDYALENTISFNEFSDNRKAGIVLWDDDNTVIGNTFYGWHSQDICTGNQFREAIGDPVGNNILMGNNTISQTYGLREAFMPMHSSTVEMIENTDGSAAAFLLFDAAL